MNYTYYFNIKAIYSAPGYDKVLINDFLYGLSAPSKILDEELYIPYSDMSVIASHQFSLDGLSQCLIDNVEYVNVCGILCGNYGYKKLEACSAEGHVIVAIADKSMSQIPRDKMSYMDYLIRGKEDSASVYESFWFNEGERLVPYRAYLPTCYDGKKSLPVVFWLHGGLGSPNQGFDQSEQKLSFFAEEHGFIIIGTDAFIMNGTYGYVLPPNPGDPNLDKSCPENPSHKSPEVLRGHKLSELCLEKTIEQVKSRFNIDTNNMFLMGNSMGGEGCFWFAIRHPGQFRAIAPAGAMINTELVDMTPLKGLPIFYTGGTEDFHGFDYLRNGAHAMKQFGLDISCCWIGGGDHPTAWTKGIDKAFDFFNKHLI